jgi:hypothetical protein
MRPTANAIYNNKCDGITCLGVRQASCSWRERGIDVGELIDGVDLVPRRKPAALFAGYDQGRHW